MSFFDKNQSGDGNEGGEEKKSGGGGWTPGKITKRSQSPKMFDEDEEEEKENEDLSGTSIDPLVKQRRNAVRIGGDEPVFLDEKEDIEEFDPLTQTIENNNKPEIELEELEKEEEVALQWAIQRSLELNIKTEDLPKKLLLKPLSRLPKESKVLVMSSMNPRDLAKKFNKLKPSKLSLSKEKNKEAQAQFCTDLFSCVSSGKFKPGMMMQTLRELEQPDCFFVLEKACDESPETIGCVLNTVTKPQLGKPDLRDVLISNISKARPKEMISIIGHALTGWHQEEVKKPKTYMREDNGTSMLCSKLALDFGKKCLGDELGSVIAESSPKTLEGVYYESGGEDRKKTLTKDALEAVGKVIESWLKNLDKVAIPPEVSMMAFKVFDLNRASMVEEKLCWERASSVIFLRGVSPALATFAAKLSDRAQREIAVKASVAVQRVANSASFGDKSFPELGEFTESIQGAMDRLTKRVIQEGRQISDLPNVVAAALKSNDVLESLFREPSPEDCFGLLPAPGLGPLTELILRERKTEGTNSIDEQTFEKISGSSGKEEKGKGSFSEKFLESVRKKRRALLQRVSEYL